MSWDFFMEIDTGGEYPSTVEGSGDINYTYNVAPMYIDAFHWPPPYEGEGIRAIDGMKGEAAIPYLQGAIQRMEENPDKYEEMNPDNGWGNSKGACKVLHDLLKLAKKHPLASFVVY